MLYIYIFLLCTYVCAFWRWEISRWSIVTFILQTVSADETVNTQIFSFLLLTKANSGHFWESESDKFSKTVTSKPVSVLMRCAVCVWPILMSLRSCLCCRCPGQLASQAQQPWASQRTASCSTPTQTIFHWLWSWHYLQNPLMIPNYMKIVP